MFENGEQPEDRPFPPAQPAPEAGNHWRRFAGGFLMLIFGLALGFVLSGSSNFTSFGRNGWLAQSFGIFKNAAVDTFQGPPSSKVYDFALRRPAGEDAAPSVATSSSRPSGGRQMPPVVRKKSEASSPKASQVAAATSSAASSSPALQVKSSASSPKDPKPEAPVCSFDSGSVPGYAALMNEIAWMGSAPPLGQSAASGANREWIELKNASDGKLDLGGWRLMSSDGSINVLFPENISMQPGQFLLLERGSDDSVPGVAADVVYSGSLSNAGEWLRLFDNNCGLVDEANASAEWPEGSNADKRTMERISQRNWQTSSIPGGTPRSQNSSGKVVYSDAPSASANASQQTQSSTGTPSATTARILLSEVFFDADGSDSGKEFIELYNPGSTDVDLNGWILKSNGSSLGKMGGKTGDNKIIRAGGYYLAGFSNYSGNPPADMVRADSLSNSGATISLHDPSGEQKDSTAYSSSTPGESWTRTSWDGGDFAFATPTPRNSTP